MTLNDFYDLSQHLKREKVFIQNERQIIHKLYNDVLQKSGETRRESWISNKQKSSLQDLILGNKEPPCICIETNNFESLQFVDAYKKLGSVELKIGEFINKLKSSTLQFAELAIACDRLTPHNLNGFVTIVVSNIFNADIMTMHDEIGLLKLLTTILNTQITNCPDVHRELHRYASAFLRFYHFSSNLLHTCRIFLTAVLHKPVMQVLMEDEWFYDIDLKKAVLRFPTAERLKRFGKVGTEEYETNVSEYGERITKKLIHLTEQFIASIRSNLFSMPFFLSSVIAHLHRLLSSSQTPIQDIDSLCLEMIVGQFICLAICDPELFGITCDAPIGYIARHNLMQISQILHTLTLTPQHQLNNRMAAHFPQNCMHFIIEGIINNYPTQSSNNVTVDDPPLYFNNAILLSWQELITLLEIIEVVRSDANTSSELQQLLNILPPTHEVRTCWRTTSPFPSPRHSPNQSLHKKNKRIIAQEGKHLKVAEDCAGMNEVLIISLGQNSECPGMLPESKVMEQEHKQNKKVKYGAPSSKVGSVEIAEGQVSEKRTRFSLSHDQESLPASDINIEAISEAASSHSVGSDVENDNLSDVMTSENVSGRATPSILSGRDTPVSQAGSQLGEASCAMAGPSNHPNLNPYPHLPRTPLKPNRGEDVTDKFGKFEIRNDIENETKSTVSDTWSTDVLASDSEPAEQNQLERLEEVAEENADNQIVEKCETASDAWSTDVLASDTSERQSERLLELDQDDFSSVSGRSLGPGSEVGDLSADDSNPTVAPPQNSNPFELAPLSRQILLRKKHHRHKDQIHSHSSTELRPSPAKAPLKSVETSKLESSMACAFSQPDLGNVASSDSAMFSGGDATSMMHTSSSASSLLIDFSDLGVDKPAPSSQGFEDAISVNTMVDVAGLEAEFLDMKLMERQSVILDDRRLSEKSASLYDPLMEDKRSSAAAIFCPQLIHIEPPDIIGSTTTKSKSSVATATKNGHEMSAEGDQLSPYYLSVVRSKNEGDKKSDKKEKGKMGFFSNFKDKLSKSGKLKNNHQSDDFCHDSQDVHATLRDGDELESSSKSFDSSIKLDQINHDLVDNILSKYRRTVISASPDALSTPNPSFAKMIPVIQYDPNNLETCPAFIAAKTKLRMVFSNVEPCLISGRSGLITCLIGDATDKDSDLMAFLKLQLASAINLQSRP